MPASEAALSIDLVEVAFPAWPAPVWAARAVAPAAPREWATQREAGKAAAIVAAAVGVPVLVAVGAVLATFVLTTAMLLAPAIAIALVWVAWRCNRREPQGAGAEPTEAGSSGGSAIR
jgi:sugar phosphate permease